MLRTQKFLNFHLRRECYNDNNKSIENFPTAKSIINFENQEMPDFDRLIPIIY